MKNPTRRSVLAALAALPLYGLAHGRPRPKPFDRAPGTSFNVLTIVDCDGNVVYPVPRNVTASFVKATIDGSQGEIREVPMHFNPETGRLVGDHKLETGTYRLVGIELS